MKKTLIFLFTYLCMNGFAQAAHPVKGLEGNYQCKGVEIGTNEPFTCALNLKKTGETYALKSTCNDGSIYTGTGIFDNHHNFSVAFINPKKSEETGLIVAKVGQDNSLESTWTYLNQTTIARASCKLIT